MGIKSKYEVRQIQKEETYPWLLQKHYAKRKPPISFAFGLYKNKILKGVCTFGKPVSSSLRVGITGQKNEKYVYELNRLCTSDKSKNLLSFFVSRCLFMLSKPKIIVSYADTKMGHHGYIYQATNFIYTGLSAKRTDWKIKGFEHLHGATIADLSRGQQNRAVFMREKYGDNFYLKDRCRKHRYIYFVGNKKQIKKFKKELKYPILKYPKGDNKKYDASFKPVTQGLLF